MSERGALVRVRHPSAGVATPACLAHSRWRRPVTTQPALDAGRVVLGARARARRRRVGIAAWLVLVGCVAVGCALHFGASDPGFARRLELGCEELEQCRQLEADASLRLADCWLMCGDRALQHQLASFLRYRSEERQAVREHYRRRGEAERLEARLSREREQEESREAQAARAQAEEREHQRRLELERLRQAQVEQRAAEQHRRRVSYLSFLGAEGRARHLRRCEKAGMGCDGLILELLDAAGDLDEKRSLAELHERLVAGEEPGVPTVDAKVAPAPVSVETRSPSPLGSGA
jgi:hypothetical protein